MSQLVTGEAVALDLRVAAAPSRAVAAGIDAVAQVGVLLVFGALAVAAGDGLSDAASAALSLVATVVVLIVYPVLFETLLRGRTPGKAAMGLRVVRDDGGPTGFRQALVRGLVGGIVEKPGFSFFLVGLLTSLLHPSGKRLGDLLAGTVVVQERVSARSGPTAHMPAPLAAWASTLELSRLPDDLAQQVRQFLARQSELTDRAREDLGQRLVTAVAAVTAPPAPPGTPGWAFLSAVVAERRRREEGRYDARAAAASPAPAGPVPSPPPPVPPSAPAPPPSPPSPAAAPPAPSSRPGGFAPPG